MPILRETDPRPKHPNETGEGPVIRDNSGASVRFLFEPGRERPSLPRRTTKEPVYVKELDNSEVDRHED